MNERRDEQGDYGLDASMPEGIEPMTVGSPEDLSDDGGWASEIKWDGVRAIAFCQDGELRLQGSQKNDLTDLFPELGSLARDDQARGTILDGELVSFGDGGVPDFAEIQNRLARPEIGSSAPRTFRSYIATFVIFDLLWADGKDLRDMPYSERRRQLESRDLNGLTWRTPGYLTAEIQATLDAVAIQNLEGLVLKRLDSPYVSGRSNNPFWLKLKNKPRQEFVVGGWIRANLTEDRDVGGLLLGYWDHLPGSGEVLRFAGVMTAGFSAGDIDALESDLRGFKRETSPFGEPVAMAGVTFVNPLRVVEIEFREWGDSELVIDPVFVGMRRDKDPGDVRREPFG